MHYVSTRGHAPEASFEDVLLAGLAPDGGLYMPQSWPRLSLKPSAIPQRYAAAAAAIFGLFTGDAIGAEELALISAEAYRAFPSPEAAPLNEIGPNLFLLELFHGPTFAFKDFAMQLLGRLMERELGRRGARTTILGATSGDTGAAAVEAFRGRKDIELFILYPHGRISEIQRRQMTSATEGNVHVLAIEGTFDDAQAIVKTLFGKADFRERYALSAINSINWARIAAQAVYYFTAARQLGDKAERLSFVVPTGNFGDIFAGYVARAAGLPVERLVVATNDNDILARALATGIYEPRSVLPTDSPSMDIQVSSNFERLLFEASGSDAGFVRDCMGHLGREGRFEIPPVILERMREVFSAFSVSREEAGAAMRLLFERSGYIADPHTAVGLAAAEKHRAQHGAGDDHPTIVLATAHPAKFPDAVEKYIGVRPAMPPALQAKLEGPERFSVLPNSAEAVATYISEKSTLHFASRGS